MKKLSTILLALVGSATLAFGEGGWMTDYDKAVEKAKTEKKHVLLDFTGSDWCGWCMKLDKEVFSKKEFKEYAAKNLVLVEVDFPQAKHLTKKVKEQNDGLQKRFNVKGYPTIIVLDPEGKQVGQLGYQEGGPAPFIAEIEKVAKK